MKYCERFDRPSEKNLKLTAVIPIVSFSFLSSAGTLITEALLNATKIRFSAISKIMIIFI